jgi:salicylate hydroxylase/6-hydroxynicotinate 3-monooxygenase
VKPVPSIAIIGAGIGGLALAAALRQRDIGAEVYEQAEQFARVGAGIQQSPNAVKVHRGLGIEARLREVAFAPATSLNRDAVSGKVTNDHPLGVAVEARYGAPYLTLHRGDLHEALAAIVPAGSVHLDKKLTGITARGSRVELTFADGSEIEADAAIGADGVHSLVRDHVVGPIEPRFTGRLAYRTTFPASRLTGVEIGSSRTKWWGADRHIVIYFVTAARDEVYFTTSQPEKADWMTRESWSTKGDLGELCEAFGNFHPDVRAVLAAAPEVHRWGIFERDPLPTWSRGRVALLGDACHPMTPYMASGAAMALEDAVVLARCLGEIGDVA